MVSINIIFGVFLTLITMGILLISSGLEIDTKQNKLRRYCKIFGYVIGNWESIPELDYVTVVRVKMTAKKFQASSDLYLQAPSSNVMFRVNLVTKDSRNSVIKVVTCEMNEAINEALKIGNALDLGVLDYTSSDRKWIKTSSNTQYNQRLVQWQLERFCCESEFVFLRKYSRTQPASQLIINPSTI